MDDHAADGTDSTDGTAPTDQPGVPGGVEVVVDAANAVGARPDGWWRDRAGAARRLLDQLERLATAPSVPGPDGAPLRVVAVHAVLEGAARAASPQGPRGGVQVHLAPADGDSAVVALSDRLVDGGAVVLVVTADRALRDRLPPAARCAGPGWLRALLDDLERQTAGPGPPGE